MARKRHDEEEPAGGGGRGRCGSELARGTPPAVGRGSRDSEPEEVASLPARAKVPEGGPEASLPEGGPEAFSPGRVKVPEGGPALVPG